MTLTSKEWISTALIFRCIQTESRSLGNGKKIVNGFRKETAPQQLTSDACAQTDSEKDSHDALTESAENTTHELNQALLDLFVSDTEESDFEGFSDQE